MTIKLVASELPFTPNRNSRRPRPIRHLIVLAVRSNGFFRGMGSLVAPPLG